MMPLPLGWIVDTAADYLIGLVYRARARDCPASLPHYGTDILRYILRGIIS